MSKVVSINFGFENCEYCDVPVKYIYSFSVNGIGKCKSYYPNKSEISEYDTADKLIVNFNEDFRRWTGVTTTGEFVILRLQQYNDICWFGIDYEDGTKDVYAITWKGDSEQENQSQKLEQGVYGLTLSVGYE